MYMLFLNNFLGRQTSGGGIGEKKTFNTVHCDERSGQIF